MHFSRGECLLRYWLKKSKLSQSDLARRTGWSLSTPDIGWSPRVVSYWCSGELQMSVEAMYTVATIIGIRMDELYRWKIVANDSGRSR